MRLGWYIHRLRGMEAGEVLWRARCLLRQRAWRARRGDGWRVPAATPAWAGGTIPAEIGADTRESAALGRLARAVHDGAWPVLAARADLSGPDPDWFRDPLTGRRAAPGQYCFDVPYRDEARIGNVKHLWEVSRLHHVTLLASAWRESGENRHAELVAAHLRSWWEANPPLCGVHWVSGIEIGLRLLGWVWTRRLMAAWPGVEELFERNPAFQRQLHAHQAWLVAFRSRGSSANNHLIAEMVGLLAAGLAFPLFADSAGWARLAAAELEREAAAQTFGDGLNRELAGGYHVFALELLLCAGCEADAAGAPLSAAYWRRVRDMADALAATVDAQLRPARQGDADDGRAVVLAAGDRSATEVLLEATAQIFGPASWWPQPRTPGLAATLLASVARQRDGARRRDAQLGRPAARASLFPAAGISILRDPEPGPEEIWCRLDHGLHGFLATAAHAHADALSFELRLGGQEILVDPGTYCYHGEPEWRAYFRSTVAHNALELMGRDQAKAAGPFLWLTHPAARLLAARGLEAGPLAEVEAAHDAYREGARGATHRRRLVLDREARSLEVTDVVDGPAPVPARLAFGLHPSVSCLLDGNAAELAWTTEGVRRRARLLLPDALRWSAHRGETDPILGWYSPGFGRKEPATLLLGTGTLAPGREVVSRIDFVPVERTPRRARALEAG